MRSIRSTVPAIMGIILLTAGVASAATAATSMSRESLINQASMDRISVGAFYEHFDRDIAQSVSAGGRLTGDAYGGYLGIDLAHWLTLFGTLATFSVDDIKVPGTPKTYGDDSKWSVGINASVWEHAVTEPTFMEGRLTIGLVAEYASFDVADAGATLEWTELAVAVPVSYYLPADRSLISEVDGLLLTAGPIYSTLDGSYRDGGFHVDFEQDKEIGLLAGAEVYLARNVTVGCNLYLFDATGYSVSLRFHF
ncbi:MAG: hypothetical protein O3A51_08365 [Verrucomicrobia bacterium]|nr:hypothetical protein [Verrucomicrobiota bacterium]